jgi:CheY-like chemotaxis protein
MTKEDYKILIVDDDESLQKLLCETLVTIGYTPVPAANGVTALNIVKSTKIDLVIADISMPEMDGLQLLQHVKEYDAHLPVLLITGVNMNNIKEQVYRIGADAFLDKPFRITKVEKILERLLIGKERSKVLLVDDNRVFRQELAYQLEDMGFRVFEASDGVEALEKLSKDHIDSVVTDWRMPDVDGVELAKQLKSNSPFTQVIIISGEVLTPEDEENLKDNSDAFLPKPFRLDTIRDILDQYSSNQ